MEIAEKVALVSGGASGLGLATARALADAGAKVVVLDLPGSPGEQVAAELGPDVRFAPADVRDENAVGAAVRLAQEELGGLHVAVSCAGIGSAARIVGRDGAPAELEPFRRVIEVNLIGTFNVMRLAAAAMAAGADPDAEECGVIVNTASIAAFDGQIGQAAYSASKGGIVGLTLPAARDLAKLRIRCVTIAPGTIDTPLLATVTEEMRVALAKAIPHPSRLGRPEEYAQLVRAIVENPLLNGETIRLDGALRMAPR